VGVLFFGLTSPIAAGLADRLGRWGMLLVATVGIIVFGLFFQPLFAAGSRSSVLALLIVGLSLMGLTYGPLGTALAGLFPTAVRYTGASLTFNLAGIVGASLAPYVATWLASRFGVAAVGYYLSGSALISLAALWAIRARSPDEQRRPVT
jgi:MFS family permease